MTNAPAQKPAQQGQRPQGQHPAQKKPYNGPRRDNRPPRKELTPEQLAAKKAREEKEAAEKAKKAEAQAIADTCCKACVNRVQPKADANVPEDQVKFCENDCCYSIYSEKTNRIWMSRYRKGQA